MRNGFSLIEAMVALAISSLLVVLIGTVFMVQGRTYARNLQRTAAHDAARSVTELVAAEIRTATLGGVVAAQPDSVTVRSPMVVGGVCGRQGPYVYVQFDGGEAAVVQDEVGGFGVRDPTTGGWSFYNVEWAEILRGKIDAATGCAMNGADTVGARDDFLRLSRLGVHHGSVPPPGSVIMLFRETTFVLRPSTIDPSTLALFRRSYGDPPLEYATGMDSTAAFSYRIAGSLTYRDQVTGLQLANVDAVRFVAGARERAITGALNDVTFGWSVNIPLRNAR